MEKKQLRLLKQASSAEYVLASGPELFSDKKSPYLSIKFSYGALGETIHGSEDFHISDYQGQVVVKSLEEEYLKRIADSLDKLHRNQTELIRKIEGFSRPFNGSGMNLSTRALEFLRGGALRKYDPFVMDIDGFSEVLSIDREAAITLYRAFQYMDVGEINKALSNLDIDVQRRFGAYFHHGDDKVD